MDNHRNVADATPVILPDTHFIIFQDFVFAYFKQEQQSLWNYRLLNLFQRGVEVNRLEIEIKCFRKTFLTTYFWTLKKNCNLFYKQQCYIEFLTTEKNRI